MTSNNKIIAQAICEAEDGNMDDPKTSFVPEYYHLAAAVMVALNKAGKEIVDKPNP